MSRQKNSSHKQLSWMLSTIAKITLILHRLNVQRTWVLVSSTLARWEAQFRDNDGDIPVIGSSNYASDEAKEIAHLKRKLRYGLVCQKNHCLDSCRHYGSINSYRNNQQGKSLSYY